MPAGFIPARAGNTVGEFGRERFVAVHPRACGEHLDAVRPHAAASGSSPRVRGTPRGPGVRGRGQRFIPARAGNTYQNHASPEASAVHPRACGEHSKTPSGAEQRSGSSPRVRGTLTDALKVAGGQRFIPARAGNAHPEYGEAG